MSGTENTSTFTLGELRMKVKEAKEEVQERKESKEKIGEWHLPPILEARCPSCNALLMFPSGAKELLCPACHKHLTVCCEIIMKLNEEKDGGNGSRAAD